MEIAAKDNPLNSSNYGNWYMQNLRQKNPDSKPTTNEIIYNDDRVIVDDKTNSLI